MATVDSNTPSALEEDMMQNGDPLEHLASSGDDDEDINNSQGVPAWVRVEDILIVQREKEQVLQDLQDAEQQIAQLTNELDDLKERNTDLELANQELQETVMELEGDIAALSTQINSRAASAEQPGSADAASPMSDVTDGITQLQNQLRSSRAREEELENRLTALQEELKAKVLPPPGAVDERHEATSLLITQLQQQIDALTTEHDEDMRKYAEEAQTTIQELQSHIEQLSASTLQLQEEIAQRDQQIAELQQPAAGRKLPGQLGASTSALSLSLSRPTSADRRRPWRPPSAAGVRSEVYEEMGRSRPMTPDISDCSKLSKAQLLQAFEHLSEELHWVNQCLTAVRDQHRDQHVRLPKRKNTEFVFATETRAKEKELHKNMHVILNYLQSLDVPPEAPTWRQLVVLYQTCQELTETVQKVNAELDQSVGELDTLRSILGVEEGMSSINVARRLISKLSDMETEAAALQSEFDQTRENHLREIQTLDEQLKELDTHLVEQGKAYDDALHELEQESTQQFQAFERQMNAFAHTTQVATRDLQHLADDVQRIANLTTDERVKPRLDTTVQQIQAVRSSVAQLMERPQDANDLAPKAILSPARSVITRSPHRAPEVLDASRVIANSKSRISEDPAAVLTNLKQHMVEQEQRHQQEMRDLMRTTEELHERQKQKLRELATLHDATEEDLYKRMVKLEVEIETITRQRDEALADLRIAEDNVRRLKLATEENHNRALELEANFEAEMQGLQQVLQREKQSHEAELGRMRAHMENDSGTLLRECKALEQQLQRQEDANKEKDQEIQRLMGEFRGMREAHAKQFEQLEKGHEEEMMQVLQRHETELQKQADALREAYEAVQDLAGQEKSFSERERLKNDEVAALENQLATERQKALDERDQMHREHQRELAQLQDMLEDLKTRHGHEVEELEHDIQTLQSEVAAQQERAQALSTALILKDEELASAREVFEEERKTFKEASERLRRNLEDLENEASLIKQQHSAEMRDMSGNATRQGRLLEEATQSNTALNARVQSLTRELNSTRAQLEAELAHAHEAHRDDVTRERAHRAELEAAFQDKVAQLVEERDGLQRELERLETRMQDEKSSSARISDEISSELAKLKSRHATETEQLQAELRKSETERTEHAGDLHALRESVRRHYEEVMRKQPAGDAQAREPLDQLRGMARVFTETVHQKDGLESKVKELEKAVRDYRDQVEQLRTDVENKEEEVSQLQSNDRAQKNNVAALQTRVGTLTDRTEALERENSDLRARITALQEELGEQAAAASNNQAQMTAVLESVKQGFSTEKQNFHKQVEGLRTELYEAQDRISDLRTQVRQTEAQVEKLKNDLAIVGAERDGLAQAVQMETVKRERAEDDVARLSQEAARLGAEVSEASARAKSRQSELDHTGALLNALQVDLDNVRQENTRLKDEMARLKDELDRLNGQLTDHEAVRQQHRNSSYEVEVLRREVNEQRKELERAQQQALQQKAQANRDKRNNAAVVADLERQLEVLNARHAKEREALVSMDANLRQLNEDKAKAERETARQREVNKNLQAQMIQQGSVLRDKERQVVSLKKRVATLEDDLSKLQLQKRSLETRARRDQSRLASDIQRHLDGQNRSMRVMDQARGGDQSVLSANNSTVFDPRLSTLGSRVRKMGADLRQERFDKEMSTMSPHISKTRPAGGTDPLSSTFNRDKAEQNGTLFLPEDSELGADESRNDLTAQKAESGESFLY
eukprot:m.194503 g.194503  ORF g.194503 m.194503 type:complete len:1732 (-) comp16792_c0_seq2:2088-7283(-)